MKDDNRIKHKNMKDDNWITHVTFFILSCFLIINCATTEILNGNDFEIFDPPGTIELDENIYADVKEISISGYALYLSWLEIVYGEDSEHFVKALPDSLILPQKMLKSFRDKYEYLKDHPIVGISYNQARLYSEWRTNRVAEFLLIQNKRIKINRKPNPENHFTINKYLTDDYDFNKAKEKHYLFPVYSIPYDDEWKKYIYAAIADSIITEGNVLEIVIVRDPIDKLKTLSIESETSIDSTVTFINKPVGQGNDYTGFRNICKWKNFKN